MILLLLFLLLLSKPCADLSSSTSPFCSDRLLNLPLIPRLSRFFSSFFHPFVFFVSLLRCVLFLLFFFFFLLTISFSSLCCRPLFVYLSSCFAAFHRLSSSERDMRRQVSNCLVSHGELLRREIKLRSLFLRPYFFRSNISDIDVSSSRAIKIMCGNFIL